MAEAWQGWVPADQQTMQCDRCLYLYHYSNGTIYYIGKAYDCTVAERRQSHADEGLITIGGFIEPSQRLTIKVGIVKPEAGQSLTDQLVSDIEALLIRQTNPSGNIQKPAVSRTLTVTCSGGWPYQQTVYSNRLIAGLPRYRGLGQ